MSRPRPHWLCFDLDGTLVDSVPDIAYSVNLMLTQLNCPSVPETMVRNWIGNGAAKLWSVLCATPMTASVTLN